MKTKTHILFSLLSVSFLLDVFNGFNGVSAASDIILLNCGSAEVGFDMNNRKWSGDSSSKFLVSAPDSVEATAEFQDPSLPSSVPYMSARVFPQEATYEFPVSGGDNYWVRLHFYPSSYDGRNASDSYFSVVSDGVTLLRNFSAAITAQALTLSYIMREFFVTPTGSSIHLTFTPSDQHDASFAFINGIEIIRIPNVFKSPATLVGFADQPLEIGGSTVQTMYRLNVGGQYIPPSNDSGLAREWYDDSPYIFGAGIGVTFSADGDVKIEYSDTVPKYIAPLDVYTTARSMGPDSNVNLGYNLTWVFQVDVNFTYVVRFHFCELIMTKINQRVFDIYLNNQTAQETADVLAWTDSMGQPVYKDYAVYVNDQPGNDQLWVALHPSTAASPEYYDSILNGLEIFKISDTTGNLAGPNPEPSAMLVAAESAADTASDSNSRAHVIGGAAGGAAAFSLVAFCVVAYQRQKRGIDNKSGNRPGWLPIYGGPNSRSSASRSTISSRSCASSHLSSLALSFCRHFSFHEIKQGTKNFNESLVIGVGGFGKVYKGVIDGGTKVAIKRANPSSEQGINEFQTEIEMLSKLRHRHLVSLIGYCDERDEMILVYDYMAHGTLREHLYKSNNPPIPWNQRLEICIGAARGLHYLHTGSKYTIIHRDVKTTNILVDEKWVAKVSDFGLSKTGPSINENHVSTVVKGSFGYLDPEYFKRQKLTEKSDVYSFGVVLFEVLCARPALNPSLPKEQVSLAEWALHCHRKGTLEDIIDPFLKGKIVPECFKKFADTAVKCLSDHGIDRPSMGDVSWNLEFALQLQEGESSKIIETQKNGPPSQATSNGTKLSGHKTKLSLGGETETSDDSDHGVFSQIPKGR